MILYNSRVMVTPWEILEDGFVQIEGSKILRTGRMDQCPPITPGDLDGEGRWVMPGLIDAHCHLGMWEDGMGIEGDDGCEDADPCMPHLRAIDAVNPMDRAFAEGLEYGVTTVVTGPGSGTPNSGQMCCMKTYGRRMDKMLVEPAAAMKFALGENPKGTFHLRSQAPVTRMGVAAVIREELTKAQRYQADKEAAEQDEDLDPPEYDAKLEALLPLLKGEMKAHFHAHRADDIFTAIRIGREFHLDFVLVHGTEGYLIAPELKEEGIPVICGPLLGSRSKPELRQATDRNPGVLARAGVPVCLCTDHPELPIQYLALTAAVAMTQGMSREDAVAAVTINPARVLGLEDRLGSLRPGCDADLLVVRGDLFTLGAKPEMVFVDGRRVVG